MGTFEDRPESVQEPGELLVTVKMSPILGTSKVVNARVFLEIWTQVPNKVLL